MERERDKTCRIVYVVIEVVDGFWYGRINYENGYESDGIDSIVVGIDYDSTKSKLVVFVDQTDQDKLSLPTLSN